MQLCAHRVGLSGSCPDSSGGDGSRDNARLHLVLHGRLAGLVVCTHGRCTCTPHTRLRRTTPRGNPPFTVKNTVWVRQCETLWTLCILKEGYPSERVVSNLSPYDRKSKCHDGARPVPSKTKTAWQVMQIQIFHHADCCPLYIGVAKSKN